LKNIIREKAGNLDENLISILLDNDTTREKFFIKIKDVIKHIIKYKIQNPIYYPIY
jgi:hypothetical protein